VNSGFEGQKVCVLGLGYVGLPLAVEFAKRHRVIGLDIDQSKIEELRKNYDRMREVTTEELAGVHIDYTTDPARMREADYIIVCVPTPIDKHNNPDLTLVENASRIVGKHMARGATVAYESPRTSACLSWSRNPGCAVRRTSPSVTARSASTRATRNTSSRAS